MQKSSKFSARFTAVGIAAGLALTLGASAWADKSAETAAPNELPLQEIRQFTDVFGAIKSYYVDQVGDKKLLEQALAGMVAGLDPHSSYLDAEAFKDLQEGTEGEFGGLGIEVTKDGKNGVQVVTPIDDTPAAKAGVRSGDLIVKIDGTFTYDLPLSKCVKRMRGKPGTDITLQIVRKGEKKPIELKLTRAIIKVQSVKSRELDNGIGYIRISQFQERTGEDLAKTLAKFRESGHLKGLVLDLRNNPGGLLDAAVEVCTQFLPKGVLVVSTRGRDRNNEMKLLTGQHLRHASQAEGPEEAKTVPLVVLVNPASASASEIVAGALQDHKRATIMGRQSFGKGSVQTVIPFSSSSSETQAGIKLTTARYYTPSGRSIQATGVTPDVEVEDTPEGNYPSFNVREADLENHLKSTAEEAKEKEKKQDEDEDVSEASEQKDDAPAPKLVYKFGDEKDFPLQQAVNFLTGKPVIKAPEKKTAKASEKTAETKTEKPETSEQK